MLSLYIALYHLFRGLRSALHDSEFKALFSIVLTMMASGTLFYHTIEGWSWLDSLYFCVVTLTTVGYGYLTPHTVGGKIFTMVYLLVGVGTLFGFLSALAHHTMKQEQAGSRRILRSARRIIEQGSDLLTSAKKEE